MKIFIITMFDNNYSLKCSNKVFEQLKDNHEVTQFPATVISNVVEEYHKRGYKYNLSRKLKVETLPKTINKLNLGSLSKASCMMSHYRLYETCLQKDEIICVLEHDAVLLKDNIEEVLQDFKQSDCELLKLHHHIGDRTWREGDVTETPYIQNKYSGGTGAYLLKPEAAKLLVQFAQEEWCLDTRDDEFIMQVLDKIGGLKEEIFTTSDNERVKSTSSHLYDE